MFRSQNMKQNNNLKIDTSLKCNTPLNPDTEIRGYFNEKAKFNLIAVITFEITMIVSCISHLTRKFSFVSFVIDGKFTSR